MGDRAGEAITLSRIGLVYSDLGEKQKALDYYNQALPLHRAVGNRSGEARTLNSIGAVYSDLGEKQKALEYYNAALPLLRTVGDRSGEAITLGNMEFTLQRSDSNLAIVFEKQAVNVLQRIGKSRSEERRVVKESGAR